MSRASRRNLVLDGMLLAGSGLNFLTSLVRHEWGEAGAWLVAALMVWRCLINDGEATS